MNPWSFVIFLIGLACLIVAYKGTEDNVIAAVKGKRYGNSTLK